MRGKTEDKDSSALSFFGGRADKPPPRVHAVKGGCFLAVNFTLDGRKGRVVA